MSEFPEQIYITEPKTYSDGETIPGTWVTKRDWCFKHEYRRVDLSPTLSAAMELPEVKAMKAALETAERKLQDAAEYWDDLCNDAERSPYTVAAKQARAALAAIKEPKP